MTITQEYYAVRYVRPDGKKGQMGIEHESISSAKAYISGLLKDTEYEARKWIIVSVIKTTTEEVVYTKSPKQ